MIDVLRFLFRCKIRHFSIIKALLVAFFFFVVLLFGIQPQGDVVVKAGVDVTLKAFESTALEGGFECEKGGVLTVEPAN